METILRGGCLCGAVRYEYAGQPGPSSYCHCDDCKRATGGPYTVGVLSRADKLRLVRGQVKGYTTKGDSGKNITRQFCPECGSPLFTRAEKCPEFVFIKAGSLDEPALIKPGCQTWTERAVAWAAIDPSLPSYPKGRPE
jgi:hypothetical protein